MTPFLPPLLAAALLPTADPSDLMPTPAAPAATFHLGDLDGDGRLDLFVGGLPGGGRLLRNDGAGGFVDVTGPAGLSAPDARAARWQDIDGDGDQDLLVLADAAPLALWRNEGRGLFVDATREAGLERPDADLDARFVDLDGDGRLDLHRSSAAGDALYLNRGGRFVPLDLGLAGAGTILPSTSGASLGVTCTKAVSDFANPGNCIPASTIPMLGMLLPLGPEWFVDAAGQVGIGTLTPAARLDVAGDVRTSGQLVSTVGSGAPFVVSSSEKVVGLNADLLDGVDASAFSQLGGSIEGAEITDGTVTAADLGPGSVGASELLAGSVTSSALVIDAVTADKIAAGAVGSSELATDAVTAGKIADEAVITSHIKDNSVTAPKIAGGAVLGSHVADGSLTGADLAVGAIDSLRIADGSVGYLDLQSPLAGTFGTILSVDNNSSTTQGRGIYVETSATGDPALEAVALSTGNGTTYGVQGLNAAANGGGIWGRANHPTGPTYGVKGEAYSSNGSGVYGQNLATSGTGTGVRATSSATSGYGLFAASTALSGFSYGVWAQNGSAGDAIHGEHTGTTGAPYAVRGDVVAPAGVALYGRHEAGSGAGQGVRGYTFSLDGYGVFSSGNFGASGVKTFVQPHPSDPTKEVRFVCLEGNEAGTYFRGRVQLVDGAAVVAVPEDFRLVSEAEELTCQLTVVGAPALVWVEALDLEHVVLRGSADVELHYVVNGVRRGYAGFETVRENVTFVPGRAGVPYGNQYPEALRRMLVANGTLNADFTPNEELAAALGRALDAAGDAGE